MNFSIHIDDQMAMELDDLVQKTRKNRNSLIREALERFVSATKKGSWPEEVIRLSGMVTGLEPFESYRREFGPFKEDPFS